MRAVALALVATSVGACASAPVAEPGGLTVAGPADYCGSAALLRLEAGESITRLVATGLHGRVFTFNSGGRAIAVAETDIARPIAGEVVHRQPAFEIVRVRGRGGVFYSLHAQSGLQVRLDSAGFGGGDADLALVRRFRLKTGDEQTCSDPGRLF